MGKLGLISKIAFIADSANPPFPVPPTDEDPVARPVVREAIELAEGPLGLFRLEERMFEV